MLAKVQTAAVLGVSAIPVTVEVDVADGLPTVTIVGLPDTTVKESKDRIKSALKNSQCIWPQCRITINLAPADVKKEGSALDFPMALGLLAASKQMEPGFLSNMVAIGELALDGSLRPVPGVLPIALSLSGTGKKLLLPSANAAEAGVVKGVSTIPIDHLVQAMSFLTGKEEILSFKTNLEEIFRTGPEHAVDFSEVKGQPLAKRAIEIAATGGHNILLMGPPGIGKSMLAQRIPSIMPMMSLSEALETTQVYSVIGGLSPKEPLVTIRPFRSPHATISDVGLVGGGTIPKPGEISLAHHGVLFLDELPEFSRAALESLRQPLENGVVTVSRAIGSVTFPARFMLVASMNPCPCGFAGDPTKNCLCTPHQIQRYRTKISGPLLDRIDLHIEVPALPVSELTSDGQGESSISIRDRIAQGRELQRRRFEGESGIHCNAQMRHRHLKRFCSLASEGKELLKQAITRLGLSARGYDRILKVSRTIADLAGSEDVQVAHLAEAIQYRALDRSTWV